MNSKTYIEQNDAAFGLRPDLFPPAQAHRLTRETRLAFAVARPTLLKRGRDRFVRRGHGDLHLGNIALIDGEPVLFDAVEFSDAIASGDVLYDLAFLLMDLEARNLRRAANRLFNHYLAIEPPEALEGVSALPLFMSLRAAIRAKVEAARADRLHGEAREEAQHACARVFRSCGEVSTLCRSAARRRRRTFGDRQERSLRRRSRCGSGGRRARSGCAATPNARRCSASRRPFVSSMTPMRRRFRAKSTEGSTTRRDACSTPAPRSCSTPPFRHGEMRAAAARISAETGVVFDGLFLEAPLGVRLARVARRRADASDADEAVVRRQQAEPLGERGWSAIDASGGFDATVAHATAKLGLAKCGRTDSASR